MQLGHFMPSIGDWLVEPRARDPELGILGELLLHQLHEVRLETQVGVETQDVIHVLPCIARKELHDHRFAAGFAGTIARQVYRLNPSILFRRLVEDFRGAIGGAVIDNDPALRQTRLRRHALNQPGKELFFVAGWSYRYVSIHYISKPGSSSVSVSGVGLSLNAHVHPRSDLTVLIRRSRRFECRRRALAGSCRRI